MSQEDSNPKTIEQLKSEYDQYCRLLGETEYLRWAKEQEASSLKHRMYELNKAAAELTTPKAVGEAGE